ncbi:hypothetical protein FGB62_326g05 [Gracilaria domingensis]|nr:hypothetical protein FGB62_326g05 [Gracilaria domingensis]
MYTPSAESLAVFDQLKAEVDHKRSEALASLKATRTACKETGDKTGKIDGKCISGTSASSWFHLLSPGQPTALPRAETICNGKEKGTVEDMMEANELERPKVSRESSGIVSNPCSSLLSTFEVRENTRQTSAFLDPLSLSSSIKSWRVSSSSTCRQSSAVLEEVQSGGKGSSASVSSCAIGGVSKTGSAKDCSSTSVSLPGGWFKALPGCARKDAIAEKPQMYTKVSTCATGTEAVEEVKVVSWQWFEAHPSEEHPTGSLRAETAALPRYTPSAESLTVFDEVKAEVDKSRSSALASLKAIRRVNGGCFGDGGDVSATNSARSWWDSSSFPIADKGRTMKQGNIASGYRDESSPFAEFEIRARCREAGEHGRTLGFTPWHDDLEVEPPAKEARKKSSAASCVRGNDGMERFDGALSIPATGADAKESPASGEGAANNGSALEQDGELRDGERNMRKSRRRAECSKTREKKVGFGPMTKKETEAAQWCEAVREHQRRLRAAVVARQRGVRRVVRMGAERVPRASRARARASAHEAARREGGRRAAGRAAQVVVAGARARARDGELAAKQSKRAAPRAAQRAVACGARSLRTFTVKVTRAHGGTPLVFASPSSHSLRRCGIRMRGCEFGAHAAERSRGASDRWCLADAAKRLLRSRAIRAGRARRWAAPLAATYYYT